MNFAARQRAGQGDPPAVQRDVFFRSQSFIAGERRTINMPDHLARDMRINQLTCPGIKLGPTPPDNSQRSAISRRIDFICAIRCHQHSAVRELEKWNERCINLLDRIRKSRQPMWRRQIIGHPGFGARCDWQSERETPLPHKPNACRPIAAPKEFKTRNVRSDYFSRKRFYLLARQGLGEPRMRQRRFAQKARCLLPLTLARDVGIIAASERENRKHMRLIIVVITQPAPGFIVGTGQLLKWGWSEFRMACEETHDFHRVLVTDHAHTAAPRVTVTIG